MLQYLTTERREDFDGATPERMITLFYDQAIDELHTAISAIARNDIQERCNAVTRTIEILGEMLQCLNLDPKDDVARNVHRIHNFIISRLPRVNFYNDAKFAAESVKLLKTLRDAWSVVSKYQDEIAAKQAQIPVIDLQTGRPKLTLISPVA